MEDLDTLLSVVWHLVMFSEKKKNYLAPPILGKKKIQGGH